MVGKKSGSWAISRSVVCAVAMLAISAAYPREANAGMTGCEVLEKCDSGDPSETIAHLAGGMAFGTLVGQGLGGPGREFCPPNSGRLSHEQYRKVTCDFLRRNPRAQAQDGFNAMASALLKIYPCAPALAEP